MKETMKLSGSISSRSSHLILYHGQSDFTLPWATRLTSQYSTLITRVKESCAIALEVLKTSHCLGLSPKIVLSANSKTKSTPQGKLDSHNLDRRHCHFFFIKHIKEACSSTEERSLRHRRQFRPRYIRTYRLHDSK